MCARAVGEQSWASCRSRDSNPQPWVSSPTLYPRLPGSLHITHPKRIRTWSSGQPSYGAMLKGTSVVVLNSIPAAQDSNPRTLGYKPDSLTIRPRLPLKNCTEGLIRKLVLIPFLMQKAPFKRGSLGLMDRESD